MTSPLHGFANYIWPFCVVIVALNLLYGRVRASALVGAGRVTKAEVTSITWGAFTVVGGAFAGLWVVQLLAGVEDPRALMEFPPRRAASISLWIIQGLLSGSIVWWLWVRNGADLLARLAPAFTQGSVLGRQFSAKRVRLYVTAFVVLAPFGNILAQLARR